MLEDFSLSKAPKPSPKAEPVKVNSLKSLNLDTELYDRYIEAKDFLEGIKGSEEIPPNQVAQVMNTVTSILKEITKMQTELYDAERLKKLEYCMIEAIKGTSDAIQDKFFAQYAQLLGEKHEN